MKNSFAFSEHNQAQWDGVFLRMKFDIIPNSKKWFTFSGVLLITSIVFIAGFGLNLGIDFKGGTQMEVGFANTAPEIGVFSDGHR